MSCYRTLKQRNSRNKYIKRTRYVCAQRFISEVVDEHGKHPVSTDGGTWYPPQACTFLKAKHHVHSFYEKSIIEITMQYIKDKTAMF
jgi:putative transposase